MGESEDIKRFAESHIVTDENIEEIIKKLISNESDKINSEQLWDTMKKCKFSLHIFESFAQIITFGADVFARSKATGFVDFMSDNPKYSTNMTSLRIRSTALKTAMKKRIWAEPGPKDSLGRFI